ncbi:MAG: nitronate monooxygenase [Gammaproteobacteria bacterium]|nr:nitronate monooxygenase [Gammaproteobacteria bacterium]
MWHDRRILDLLDIEHPIVLAPMAAVSNAELVGLVSEAGGLGSYGAAGDRPDRLRTTVQTIRQRTNRAFNINLFSSRAENYDRDARSGPRLAERLEAYHAELGLGPVPDPRALFGPVEEQFDVLIEEGVPIISFHFGVDAHLVAGAHEAGTKVLCSATTVAEAKELEDIGVDAVIAQGSEAGGHRGTFTVDYRQALIGTMALVPQIVDAVSVPVIAAGGIADGRGIAAAFALGASGVQMGTAFLSCPEAKVSEMHRNALRHAGDQDTRLTRAFSGRPARARNTRYIDAMAEHRRPVPAFPRMYGFTNPLRQAAAAEDDPNFQFLLYGQAAALNRELPAAELVETLVAEAQEVLGGR